MRCIFFFLLVFFCSENGFAQTFPVFKQLRYEEDYSFLRNDTTRNLYRRIKFFPLSAEKNTFISYGGEARLQFFYVHNEKWGDAPKPDDGYFLNRWLAHADLHAGSQFRFFGQLQSSLSYSRVSPSPVDENPLEIHQAFADLSTKHSGKSSFVLRIGRQELSYGAQRLISVREGPNNRQSFDALKGILSLPHQRLDVFYSSPVAATLGTFNDRFNRNAKFWGVYYQRNNVPIIKNIDLYYLGLWKRTATFNDGRGKELRHSVGTRIWDNKNNWQYDFEALYQFGKFANKNIRAWTVSLNTSYALTQVKTQPTFGLKTEYISGDRTYGDNQLQTFNPLFPRGAYFGLAALIGPVNLIDIHPSISFNPAKQLGIGFDYDLFWRSNANDGLYAANTSLIYPGHTTTSNNIGKQLACAITCAANGFLNFTGEFTWFHAGSYLRAVGSGRDIIFTGLTTQVKF